MVGHTGFADAEIVIPAGSGCSTFIMSAFDIAGLPTGHVRLEFSSQVTTCSLPGV
jgi:hypothetical protein